MQSPPFAQGPTCEADCLAQLDAHGFGCKSAAASLGECFQTYTCQDDMTMCSHQMGSFEQACGP